VNIEVQTFVRVLNQVIYLTNNGNVLV